MRVAIFTYEIAPYHNARYLGAARHVRDVHVLSMRNQGEFAQFLATDIGPYSVHTLFGGARAYAAAAASGELARAAQGTLAAIAPDAILANGWTAPDSLAALAYGRQRGVPVILMSESQGGDAARSPLREAVKRRVVSQFDAALVGGPPHAAYVRRLGMKAERIHYGYNAVDNAHFAAGAAAARADEAAVRARHGLPRRYLLASARFIAKKNLPGLVSAYAAARARAGVRAGPDVRASAGVRAGPGVRASAGVRAGAEAAPDLVILGDGPERAAVEAAIAAEGVGAHVHLPGFRSYAELPAFYGLAEGLAHVSTVEQWGLVINEAMAAGVPVIASRPCGAARTLIADGVSGLLTDPDVASMAETLARFFAMGGARRAAMGRAAAGAIANWGPERFGTGLMAALESARAAPRRGPFAPWDWAIMRRLRTQVIDAVA